MDQIACVATADSHFELVEVIDDRKKGQQFFENRIASSSN